MSKQHLLSTPLHGLYIPAGLIVVGTAIMKIEWTLYSIGFAAVLMAFKVFRGREFCDIPPEGASMHLARDSGHWGLTMAFLLRNRNEEGLEAE